jgi:hypothetical protein
VVIYRKRVHHLSPKNYQLDLFSPDDGYFEYSAVATNLALTPQAFLGCSFLSKYSENPILCLIGNDKLTQNP